jgi:hypothetical protein
VTETTKKAAPNKALMIAIGAVVAVAVAAGVYYYRGGFDQGAARVADKDKVDPDVAVLMASGPLPDIVIGSADAPNTAITRSRISRLRLATLPPQPTPTKPRPKGRPHLYRRPRQGSSMPDRRTR